MRIITSIMRTQHQEIRADLNRLLNLVAHEGFEEDADTIKDAINKLEHRLMVHLVQEDFLLYPKLVNHPDEAVQMAAFRVIKELGDLGERFDQYTRRWRLGEAIQQEPEEFVKDTRAVLEALRKRIDQEDYVVFPMVE